MKRTPIQQQAIPAVLEGRDLMAYAAGTRQNSGLYAAAVATPDHSPAARQRASSGTCSHSYDP
ncbi:hypothetical protein ACLB1E_28135 [Escherichia coli]